MTGSTPSAHATVLAQAVTASSDKPLIVLGVIVALAFVSYLVALALTLRRERPGRQDGPGRNT